MVANRFIAVVLWLGAALSGAASCAFPASDFSAAGLGDLASFGLMLMASAALGLVALGIGFWVDWY